MKKTDVAKMPLQPMVSSISSMAPAMTTLSSNAEEEEEEEEQQCEEEED